MSLIRPLSQDVISEPSPEKEVLGSPIKSPTPRQDKTLTDDSKDSESSDDTTELPLEQERLNQAKVMIEKVERHLKTLPKRTRSSERLAQTKTIEIQELKWARVEANLCKLQKHF